MRGSIERGEGLRDGGGRWGGREERWPDSRRLVANITSPLGATNATALIFLLLLSSHNPTTPLHSQAFYPLVSPCCSLSSRLRPLASFFFISRMAATLVFCHPLIPPAFRIFAPRFQCPSSVVPVLPLSSCPAPLFIQMKHFQY